MAAHRPRHGPPWSSPWCVSSEASNCSPRSSMGYRLPACQGRVETPLGQSSKHGPTAGRRSSMAREDSKLQPDRYERHYPHRTILRTSA